MYKLKISYKHIVLFYNPFHTVVQLVSLIEVIIKQWLTSLFNGVAFQFYLNPFHELWNFEDKFLMSSPGDLELKVQEALNLSTWLNLKLIEKNFWTYNRLKVLAIALEPWLHPGVTPGSPNDYTMG